MMQQIKIKIISINVGGINDRRKRRVICEYLRYLRPDYLCLQETHLALSESYALAELGMYCNVSSSQAGKTKGVAVMSRMPLDTKPRCKADIGGRWAIMLVRTASINFTICTFYGSIIDDPEPIEALTAELYSWPAPLIVCGGFNSRPMIASDGRTTVYRKPKVRGAMQRLCEEHNLVDVWNAQNPMLPVYTYYSASHRK